MNGLLLVVFALFAPFPPSPAQADEDALAADILSRGEDADPERIRELANLRTSGALDALVRSYDLMQSIAMRRTVLLGLVLYDEVAGLERIALQKVMDAATTSSEPEMRMIAVDLLAGCRNHGKALLARIVESAVQADVRERALRYHAGHPRPEDLPWYRELLESGGARKAGLEGGGAEVRAPLEVLREIAFEAVRRHLTLDELFSAMADRNARIRALALEELGSRDEPAALEFVERVFEEKQASTEARLRAARILAAAEWPGIVERLIEAAMRSGAGEEFTLGIADILASSEDEEVRAKILKHAGKGDGLQLVFSLRAARNLDDPRLDEILLDLLDADDPRVRRESRRMLAERKSIQALPRLEQLLSASKDGAEIAGLLEAIGRIHGADADWLEFLSGYARHADLAVRNATLETLGATGDERWLPVLMHALEHESWSTRLVAALGVERVRSRQGIWALVLRLEKETGRMALELSEILFRLTGQPFGTNARAWAAWWRERGYALDPVAAGLAEKLEREVEARRLRQRTRGTFYGLYVSSQRLIFVIDVSGSMLEPTSGRYAGEQGEPRIERAKKEVLQALDGLARPALFNIVTFNLGVHAWAKGSEKATDDTLADAKGFVQRLGADGGTDLYGALSYALSDPDVDTIYVLSDGEPTVGELVDPLAIREAIAEQNRQRRIVFHCVAVGGSLSLLEWLARDSGGTYVRFP